MTAKTFIISGWVVRWIALKISSTLNALLCRALRTADWKRSAAERRASIRVVQRQIGRVPSKQESARPKDTIADKICDLSGHHAAVGGGRVRWGDG